MRKRVAGFVGAVVTVGAIAGGSWYLDGRRGEQARSEAHAYTWTLLDAIAEVRGVDRMCGDAQATPDVVFGVIAEDPRVSREGFDNWVWASCDLR